jgi:hypothetical protein
MLRRRFAAIKLWPGVKAAEDEVIERLKIAASALGLECLVVDASARLIHPPYTQLTQADVDFVLSLHFETPKQFDIFSFVTLWNPLQFYHEWGYRKFTRHLLTHDDFLSCDSVSGDDHVLRSISLHGRRERPLFHLYPSVSSPVLEPNLGDQHMFYAGMNWEKSSQKPGRYDALLRQLDRGGRLRIYGPRVYVGVEVWRGFQSYLGPIPFDGVSVVRLIHQAGISLVLSSQAHCESEMMSSRIFESLAAGAVVICNENPFARRHFGDSLLYIDTTLSAEETCGQVENHLAWIQSEPAKALEMARRSQAIFRERFRLDTCLQRIYEGLPARKAKLECAYTPRRPEEKICIAFLMPEFRPEILEQHMASYAAQVHVAARGILLMDARDAELFGARVRARLEDSSTPLEIAPVRLIERRPDESIKLRKPVGEVLDKVLGSLVRDDEDYVCLVAPNERLFSDHLSSLLRALQDSPEAGCAWADMLQSESSGIGNRVDLRSDPDAASAAEGLPIGFGRFLFRSSALEERLHTALPYLDTLAIHLLFASTRSMPSRRCTLIAESGAFAQEGPVPAALEREILADLVPESVQPKSAGFPAAQRGLVGLTQQERIQLAVELAHSVPFPPLLKKLAFGTYRWWLRAAGSHRNGKQ